MQSQTAEIHSVLDVFAQRRRTTAVLETAMGTIAAGGSVRDLTSAQMAVAETMGMTTAKLPGFHAEFTALSEAGARGWEPRMITTSSDICPNCRANLIP